MPRPPLSSKQTDAVLGAFMLHPQAWRHGYDLSRDLGLKSGTLYPLLMRLSDQGLLEAEWRPSVRPGRPPRHAYRLTAAGAAYARSRGVADVPGNYPSFNDEVPT